MSRACLWLAFAACALGACDDGVLRAFEPRPASLGSSGNGSNNAGSSGKGVGGLGGGSSGASPEGGGGRGGSSSVDPSAGAGPAVPTSPLLIDDFEDGDMQAEPPLGWWYPVNDSTGTQGTGIEPIAGAGASVYALRTHGSDFTNWGAAVGVNLAGDSTPLNARGYERLCFVARVEPDSNSTLQVHLLRDPGVHYLRDVSLSETWTRYCLPLADFISMEQAALIPDELIALQFFFAPGAAFELWLDDVQLEP